MFATAPALVTASLLEQDPSASPAALRQGVFLRFYGGEFTANERERIVARLGRVERGTAPLAEEGPAGAYPAGWMF
jgi:hypothetical protein